MFGYIRGVSESLWEAFTGFLQDILTLWLDFFTGTLGWLWSKLFAVMAYMWDWAWSNFSPILKAWAYEQAVATGQMFEALPVPQVLQDFPAQWAAVPWASIGFWIEPFQIEYGATVILGVQLLRLTLRWIPFLGRGFMAGSE